MLEMSMRETISSCMFDCLNWNIPVISTHEFSCLLRCHRRKQDLVTRSKREPNLLFHEVYYSLVQENSCSPGAQKSPLRAPHCQKHDLVLFR